MKNTELAYPFIETNYGGEILAIHEGLTKREIIAKDLPMQGFEFTHDEACEFLGFPPPPKTIETNVNLAIQVEMKLRVMRADALLLELEK